MNVRRVVLRTLVGALAFTIGACVDVTQPNVPAPTPGPAANPVPVIGVRVTPQTLQFIAIGANQQLTATVAPLDATDQGVRWASSDTSVATVDATGRVTSRKAGDGVFITAFTRDGSHQASVNVTVVP